MNYRDFFKEDMLPGGKGDKTSVQSVDPKQLAMGIKVEMEHTNDAKKAREIAMDHLTEDPQYYSKLQQAGLADELGGNNKGIKEIDADPSNNQTAPGTTYPKVDSDPSKGPDMAGGIDKTAVMKSKETSDVDSTPKDPTPTDHITGGMGSTPVNQQILSKGGCGGDISQSGVATSKVATFDMLKAIGNKGMGGVAKDISIDIAEGKDILNKMINEPTKEGVGGDPDTDPKYVKGKRWTLKW